MENFTTESRYLKLCNEFKTVIRFMKTVFHRPDYEELLMCPLIKRLSQAFVSKHVGEPLKHSTELLKHLAKLLKHSAEVLRV